MTQQDGKERIRELRQERIELLDSIEDANYFCRDDLAMEYHEYLRQVNAEIARLMATVYH